MSLPTLDKTFNYITTLPDEPTISGGYTAATFKALFDQAPVEIKTWINETFIPALESAIDAAAQGVPTGGGISTSQIADLAITAAKLADGSVSTDKIASSAVTEAKLDSGCVSAAKLATGSVVNSKIYTGAVTTDKIADGNVAEAKLADAAVTSDKIGLAAVITNKIADGAVTSDKIDSTVQARRKTHTVDLDSGATSWTVTVEDVTAKNVIIVSPIAEDHDEYNNCGVRCTAQSLNTLTFTSLAAPTNTLTVNIIILD